MEYQSISVENPPETQQSIKKRIFFWVLDSPQINEIFVAVSPVNSRSTKHLLLRPRVIIATRVHDSHQKINLKNLS